MTDQLTVLVVDDERPLADVRARWLEDDYDVRTAYSGEDALESIDETVDVVVLDQRMPGLSGDDVLVAMHERGLDPGIVVVSGTEPGRSLSELGYDAFLLKGSVEPETLRETIESVR